MWCYKNQLVRHNMLQKIGNENLLLKEIIKRKPNMVDMLREKSVLNKDKTF